MNPDGTFTYAHDGGETTSDRFTYRVNDGTADSAPATVRITVTPANDAPAFVGAPYVFHLTENQDGRTTPAPVGTVIASDPEDDEIAYRITAGDTARFSIHRDSGAIVYVGAGENFEKAGGPPEYALTVTATAGGLAANVPVTVMVTGANDPPMAMDDGIMVTEGETVTTLMNGAMSVLDNDRDVDTARGALTASMMTPPVHGELTLNEDGTFSYTHNGNRAGNDRFTYQVIDDGGNNSNEATVMVLVQSADAVPRSDALKGWLARFGRTVAGDIEEGISERMTGASSVQTSASYVVIGGHRMSLEPPAVADVQSNNTGTPDDRTEPNDVDSETMSGRELLSRSAFQISLNESGNAAGGGNIVLWGRGGETSFDGRDDNLKLDGEVTSTTFGIERMAQHSRAGIALTHSEGRGGWKFEGGAGDENGLKTDLTTVYPYMRRAVSEALDVWGLLGYGRGEVHLKEKDTGEETETDIAMKMAAVGARYQLDSPHWLDLALKANAFAMEIEADDANARRLQAVEANARRFRVALAGRFSGEVSGDARLTPGLELGLRRDGGDAESGAGADVVLDVHYVNSRTGWDVRAWSRYLLDHKDQDYEEHSAGLAVRFDPGAPGRGLALTLEPEWDEKGSSQRIGLDLTGMLKDRGWNMPSGLRLELSSEWGATKHSVRLIGSFRF